MSESVQLAREQDRIFSIDFFRGFTMFMLVGGLEGLFSKLDPANQGPLVNFIQQQLSHVPWEGLNFWDLIQPFFCLSLVLPCHFRYGKDGIGEIAG